MVNILCRLFPRHFRRIHEGDVIDALIHGEGSAIDIHHYLADKHGMSFWWFTSSSWASLYSLLWRMEDEGTIIGVWRPGNAARGMDPGTGKPRRRRVYMIADRSAE
jgi:hypothetical protein